MIKGLLQLCDCAFFLVVSYILSYFVTAQAAPKRQRIGRTADGPKIQRIQSRQTTEIR
jgi:hypothetical protein